MKYAVKFPVNYIDTTSGYYYDENSDCSIALYDSEREALERHRQKGLPEEEIDRTIVVKSIGVCKRCGSPLFPSDIPEYTSQCFTCDEDFFYFEQKTDIDIVSRDAEPKQLRLVTVGELAKLVCGKINPKRVNQPMRLYTFAVADRDFSGEEDIEYIKSTASGWHGITRVDAGFDSEQLTLCVDYYGGGSQFIITTDGHNTPEERLSMVTNAIVNSLQVSEGDYVNEDTMLIAEDDYYDDAISVYIIKREGEVKAVYTKSKSAYINIIDAEEGVGAEIQRLIHNGRLKRVF